LCFACVYFFWGSTYTAIRVAGEHLAPTLVSAARSLLTVTLLVTICAARGQSLRVPAAKAWRLALIGILFMTCNNVLLTWAETMVPSGLASLVVSTMPIAVALLEAGIPGGEALNRRGWAGTLLGTVGMAALVWPSLSRHRGGYGVFPFVLLFLCVLPFAVGSVLSRRFNFRHIDTLVAATWQLGAAAVTNTTLALAGGTLRTAEWSWKGCGAIVYLAVFGSLVGYSCYTYLLKHVAVTKASTYAFVNPVVAVLLGVTLLHERLAPSEIAGMVVILAAVAMVIFSRVKLRAPEPEKIADAME
jgi:drug/metabolite transporter (DMT)-like permease